MMIPPTHMIGANTIKRRPMITRVCTWIMSLVVLVIREAAMILLDLARMLVVSLLNRI